MRWFRKRSFGANVMEHPRVPDIFAAGCWWPADRTASRGATWLSAITDQIDDAVPCAAAAPFSADGVALFAAVSSRGGAAALLPPDPRLWPDRVPLYHGMPLVLLPEAAAQADEAARRGFRPLVLRSDASEAGGSLHPLRCSGFVIQTSGSTGAPKIVFRPMAKVVAGAMVRARQLGLVEGDGLIGGVPLFSGQGIVQSVTAMTLGGPLGLLGPVDHREALKALAEPVFRYWRATPHFVGLLTRCRVTGDPRVPAICLTSTATSESLHRAFAQRFGVPLRGTYSSTETGAVSVDAAPDPEVRWDSVGRLLPGVELRVGDQPSQTVAPGAIGRLWVRSRWIFDGYGVPPACERPGMVEGFFPTRDLGRLDTDGRLFLRGRIDDCVRTREGRLVDLAAIAARLRDIRQVSEAVVVAVPGAAGASIGAVVECSDDCGLDRLRAEMAAALPSFALPRHLVVRPELPRLANGKPDRLACLTLLGCEVEPA
jgi:acyl-CoA synthetase (AMP-forming)/AMP-acid ligase II